MDNSEPGSFDSPATLVVVVVVLAGEVVVVLFGVVVEVVLEVPFGVVVPGTLVFGVLVFGGVEPGRTVVLVRPEVGTVVVGRPRRDLGPRRSSESSSESSLDAFVWVGEVVGEVVGDDVASLAVRVERVVGEPGSVVEGTDGAEGFDDAVGVSPPAVGAEPVLVGGTAGPVDGSEGVGGIGAGIVVGIVVGGRSWMTPSDEATSASSTTARTPGMAPISSRLPLATVMASELMSSSVRSIRAPRSSRMFRTAESLPGATATISRSLFTVDGRSDWSRRPEPPPELLPFDVDRSFWSAEAGLFAPSVVTPRVNVNEIATKP